MKRANDRKQDSREEQIVALEIHQQATGCNEGYEMIGGALMCKQCQTLYYDF